MMIKNFLGKKPMMKKGHIGKKPIMKKSMMIRNSPGEEA
jgi:hypothetical protein